MYIFMSSIYTHIYIHTYIYIYIFLENSRIHAPVFGGVAHTRPLFLYLCPYLTLFALFVDTTCTISPVGWPEIGSLSKSFVSCLFLLAQYWAQCFVGPVFSSESSARSRARRGGWPQKKNTYIELTPLPFPIFFVGAPPWNRKVLGSERTAPCAVLGSPEALEWRSNKLLCYILQNEGRCPETITSIPALSRLVDRYIWLHMNRAYEIPYIEQM